MRAARPRGWRSTDFCCDRFETSFQRSKKCDEQQAHADSVYVLFNQYQSNKQSGLSESKMTAASSFIQEDPMPIAKKDLAAMKEKGEIQGVNR